MLIFQHNVDNIHNFLRMCTKKVTFYHFFVTFCYFFINFSHMSGKRAFLGLKKFRERKELRQNQLAKMLGVTSATYNNWEIGKRDASFDIYKKLFELEATVEELFGINYNEINNLAIKGASPASPIDVLMLKIQQLEEDVAELKGVKKGIARAG